jgi:selenocysteine lyase/cysteine desulfurase
VLCTSWVHSFSGFVTDLQAVGEVCRQRGVWFLVNTTQGLGARTLDVASLPVDGVVNAGWKWLLGPYATGFCWLRPELLERLEYNQSYWLARFTADDLGRDRLDLDTPAAHPARGYDLFAPANFFNFVPWCASLELLLEIGPGDVERYDQELVARLLAGLDTDHYRLLSPEAEAARSTLVFLEHRERDRNPEIHRSLADAGIDVALRRGALRIAPHVHNRAGDIDRLLEVLAGHSTFTE